VFGTLFRRDDTAVTELGQTRLDAADSRAIASSAGRILTQRYWGRYVAVLRDSATSRIRVLRDPCGGLPCWQTRHGNVWIYFSCATDCIQLGLAPFSIDWDRVGTRIVSPAQTAQHRSALQNVDEVQPGECVEVDGADVKRERYWQAATIARSNVIEDPLPAADALRTTARACVHAWASCYEHILHRLSGGLDSSIVMSCLAEAPSRASLVALNGYLPDSDGDERAYARLAARRAGCTLIEHEIDVTRVRLERLLMMTPGACPDSAFSWLVGEQIETRLIAERGMICGGFSGGGGDQVFYSGRAYLAAVDRWQRYGLRRGLLDTMLDAARLDHVSFWSVLGSIARSLFHLRRSRLPPGKAWHAYLLSFPQPFYNPLGRIDDPESVFPLASQPLIELCLRIPAYVMLHHGQNRGLARLAFRRDLPREILVRQSKGGAEHYGSAVFVSNLKFLRELLLDGMLIGKGLLDKDAMEWTLSGKAHGTRASGVGAIFDYASLEAWVRAWSRLRQRAGGTLEPRRLGPGN
jgi:asparagine synthase (glutamine-hydrolysing)